jgi:uncharacterized protein YfcZ (UPF0381/DUF406 family)
MGWVLLIVVIILIILAIHYWYITLAIVGIGTVIYLIVKANEKKMRRQAEEAARKAEEEARLQCHREEQQGYRKQMIVLGEHSLNLFESMPEHLSLAERHLNQAEIDFADGAFAPFWDSIENAARALGHFDEGVHHIKDNSSCYTELIRKYEDAPPQFPIALESVAKLGIATATAERMKGIVRTAQCNFEFATIYEQRKTNQILVAGFTSLAQALDRMTVQITASIDDLRSSVDLMSSTLNDSLCAIHTRMSDMAETSGHHHEELMEGASTGASREKAALEMLDNIQHGRRPSV